MDMVLRDIAYIPLLKSNLFSLTVLGDEGVISLIGKDEVSFFEDRLKFGRRGGGSPLFGDRVARATTVR